MKKKVFFLIALIMILLIPTRIKAVTLSQYESMVTKYQNEVNATNNAIKKTKEEIEATKRQIENSKTEIQNLNDEIKKLNEEIELGNKEIKEKSLQIKQLFEYLQMASGENVYLEYAFGAESVTDLIYRMSIVEQMTEYNDKKIDEIEAMVEKNKRRQEEIKQKQSQINEKIKSLEKNVLALGAKKNSLTDGGVTSTQQLKIYNDIVASYKKMGCKSSDVIGVDCAKTGTAGVFRRPVSTGYITSEFGSRWGSFHRGIDISNEDPYNTKIYSVANGTISAKYIDLYGALVVGVEHYDAVSGKWYTSLYAHMSQYAPNIYVGRQVTSDDYLGYMGNTGWSTGPHLHLEVSPCRLYKDSNCSTWDNYANYVKRMADNGYKGPRQMIAFPSGTWYTR